MSQTQTTNNEDPDKLLNDWLGELDNLIGVSQDKKNSPEKSSNFPHLRVPGHRRSFPMRSKGDFLTLNFQENSKHLFIFPPDRHLTTMKKSSEQRHYITYTFSSDAEKLLKFHSTLTAHFTALLQR